MRLRWNNTAMGIYYLVKPIPFNVCCKTPRFLIWDFKARHNGAGLHICLHVDAGIYADLDCRQDAALGVFAHWHFNIVSLLGGSALSWSEHLSSKKGNMLDIFLAAAYQLHSASHLSLSGGQLRCWLSTNNGPMTCEVFPVPRALQVNSSKR